MVKLEIDFLLFEALLLCDSYVWQVGDRCPASVLLTSRDCFLEIELN